MAQLDTNNSQTQWSNETLQQKLREIRNNFVHAQISPPELEPEDLHIPTQPHGFEITNDIYISHFVPSFQREFLKSFGIKAIICLSGHHNKSDPETLGVRAIFSVDMPDGEGTTSAMIRSYTAALHSFLKAHGRTLVLCQAGQSRSPSLVAAYLARYRNMELESALELVRKAREPEREVKYWRATLTAIGKALEEV
jgi:hypothetical protein